jgi:hypothetical protein
MKLVKHLLDAKGRKVVSIAPDASVFDAIKMMADESIGSLVVMDADDKLVGIVTERDYARKVIVKGRSSHDTSVAEIMTADVRTASSDHHRHGARLCPQSHRQGTIVTRYPGRGNNDRRRQDGQQRPHGEVVHGTDDGEEIAAPPRRRERPGHRHGLYR